VLVWSGGERRNIAIFFWVSSVKSDYEVFFRGSLGSKTLARRDLTGAVDFGHLEAYTLNDAAVIEEVLRLFQHQCELWAPLLTTTHEGWRDAAHTIKGAAGGIGAHALAAAAEAAERGDDTGAPTRLERVLDHMNAALMDVAAYLHELRLRDLKA
jgi:HPt (histidine-containing phosphotransfer) domain-containing protein